MKPPSITALRKIELPILTDKPKSNLSFFELNHDTEEPAKSEYLGKIADFFIAQGGRIEREVLINFYKSKLDDSRDGTPFILILEEGNVKGAVFSAQLASFYEKDASHSFQAKANFAQKIVNGELYPLFNGPYKMDEIFIGGGVHMASDLKGQGLGPALMTLAMEKAKDRGARLFIADHHINNTSSARMQDKLGFIPDSRSNDERFLREEQGETFMLRVKDLRELKI